MAIILDSSHFVANTSSVSVTSTSDNEWALIVSQIFNPSPSIFSGNSMVGITCSTVIGGSSVNATEIFNRKYSQSLSFQIWKIKLGVAGTYTFTINGVSNVVATTCSTSAYTFKGNISSVYSSFIENSSYGTLTLPTISYGVGPSDFVVGLMQGISHSTIGSWNGNSINTSFSTLANQPGYSNAISFALVGGSPSSTIASVSGVTFYDTQSGSAEALLILKCFSPLVSLVLPSLNDYAKSNIDYVRQQVNQFRSNNGLSAWTWTDPTIIQGVTPVKAQHWNEIQQAIDDVYTQIGQTYANTTTQTTVKQTLTAKDPVKFPIQELSSRLQYILKGLQNQ